MYKTRPVSTLSNCFDQIYFVVKNEEKNKLKLPLSQAKLFSASSLLFSGKKNLKHF